MHDGMNATACIVEGAKWNVVELKLVVRVRTGGWEPVQLHACEGSMFKQHVQAERACRHA
jgi:hypothetical protein